MRKVCKEKISLGLVLFNRNLKTLERAHVGQINEKLNQ